MTAISPPKLIPYCATCFSKKVQLNCGNCLSTYYCSTTCSQKDFEAHKLKCSPNPRAVVKECENLLKKIGFAHFEISTENSEDSFTYIDLDKKSFSFHHFKNKTLELETLYPNTQLPSPQIPEDGLKGIFNQIVQDKKREKMVVAAMKAGKLHYCLLHRPPKTF